MRIAVAILGLAGCRSLLGFEEVVRVDDDAAAPSDGTIDASLTDGGVDMPLDTPPGSCAVDFTTIAGGQASHKYKLVVAQSDWAGMHDGCVTSGGYLAIPNDGAEFVAIFSLASTITWVGVSDQQIEGMVVDVLNVPYTALAVSNNGGARDCGVANNNDPPIDLEQCSNNHVGVCECEE